MSGHGGHKGARLVGTALAFVLTIVSWGPPFAAAPERGMVLADFESGEVTLFSHDPAQDQQPDHWELTSEDTYGGSAYSLRLYGNTWKAQSIDPYAITPESVFQVAVRIESIGEMQAFGISDGARSLLYTFAGTQLPGGTEWEVTYQGAFPTGMWQVYRLPVGRDWHTRYGDSPVIDRLVYINDRDAGQSGVTVYDDVIDITVDLPIAPQVEIVRGKQRSTRVSDTLYRVGIFFHASVFDPDSDAHSYYWDFGDGASSQEADPYHEFLVAADYTFTVRLEVQDDTGLWGRASAQIQVEPGEPGGSVSMNFVGDVMLARGYEVPGGLIDTYGPEWIFMPTREMYGDDADINVCNLECPLTDEGEPHPTKPYVFRGRPQNVAGLVYAGIDVVSLGNNHIVDFGRRGLEETEEVLDAAGILRSGAGVDEYRALQPVFLTEQGICLAFLGQCNRTGREWNYQPFLDAAWDKPGFAYLIEPNISTAIAGAREVADLVVLQAHAGIEYATGPGTFAGTENPRAAGAAEAVGGTENPWAAGATEAFGVSQTWGTSFAEEPPLDAAAPEPGQADFLFPTRPAHTDRELRWRAVEAGADLVICHHPHVLQGFEAYQGVLIAHSLGNFVFDQSFAETFPSIVLRTTFDKQGFRLFTFRPVFIDDRIPRPAIGRLGREILDRMADYSREMETIVSVDPVQMTGTVHLDPGLVEWIPVIRERTVAARSSGDGTWTSTPIEHDGPGVFARILATDAGGAIEARWGREILWHGDCEAEGATFWNLNSVDEVYDESVCHQGLRSIRLHRTPGNQGVVTTELEGFPAVAGGREFTVSGWMRTENAMDAELAARLFTGRGSGPLGTFLAGPPISGTMDWTHFWSDFQVSANANFFNMRLRMDRPGTGDAWAWYDEMRLIEWEPWRDEPLPLAAGVPNNVRYLQLRFHEPLDSIRVSWEEVQPFVPAASVPEDPPSAAAATLFLGRPTPNPFSSTCGIEYRLPRAGRVRIEVYDVAGRRRAILEDAERAAGAHRIRWETRGIAAGLYFCRLEAGGEVRMQKLVVLH